MRCSPAHRWRRSPRACPGRSIRDAAVANEGFLVPGLNGYQLFAHAGDEMNAPLLQLFDQSVKLAFVRFDEGRQIRQPRDDRGYRSER